MESDLSQLIDELRKEFLDQIDGPASKPVLSSFLERIDIDQGGAADRRRLLEVLVDAFLDRAGTPDAADRLLDANPDHVEELTPLLSRAARTLRHSQVAGGKRAGGRLSAAAGLHVRCPHCSNPIELLVDAALESVHCSSCGSDFGLVDEDFGTATRLKGGVTQVAHFKLVERVGMGAFGAVWKAHDTNLDRTVALKIPRRGQLDSQQQKALLREAQNAAQLNHPGVVPVYEVGREGDTLYIVSEFVRGLSLGDWLSGQTPNAREAADLCRRIAVGLQHAHERGVVHRDLKPDNIMLGEPDADGVLTPRLMDFGLARREAAEITMTVEGQILGTPAYMSPEQARGDSNQADARSDVYSLGVILFELLTGERPFRGNQRMLLHQVINDEPPSLRKLNGTVPRDLETITLKCLEKESDRRYQSAKSLGEDLRLWFEGRSITARPTPAAIQLWRWTKANRLRLTAIFGCLFSIALTVFFGYSLILRQDAISAHIQAYQARQEAQEALKFADSMTRQAQDLAEQAVRAKQLSMETSRQTEAARQKEKRLVVEVSHAREEVRKQQERIKQLENENASLSQENEALRLRFKKNGEAGQ